MYSFTDERAMGKRFVFRHCLLSKQWKSRLRNHVHRAAT
ncbi:hypothetical protein TGS27_0776 [Geobacillus stearothermophilus]|uniref:Uncharacterized protein n=1 Tax=Geobacillus stearothermophilus TaxID=1422 RepID=A0A150MHJ4_GEOSE|nr:hypothetical protein GS8_1092 [Geobacillus stearothermophilus]KYD24014.1 hypothetical protein B4109_1393 [Geobacillus stearothermophilus]OAO85461.1 hypothetical protein TGS27_0776 [Geobacillus stearothermophilus]